MKSILVSAAGGGGGNNLIRSIRRGKYPVRILGANADRFALGQSLADENFLLPSGHQEEAYIAALRRLVKEEAVELVIPNNDTEVGTIAKYQGEIGAATFLPKLETVEMSQDKFALTQELVAKGFRVAETRSIEKVEQVEELFKELKQNKLWCRPRKGSGSRGAIPVIHPDQAVSWIKYWESMRGMKPGMFLLSEFLPGRDFAFQSLWRNGELVIAKTVERIDYIFGANMPSGTSSSPRVGKLVNDTRVNELCTAAVRSIDPSATGMFCIDLKEADDSTPCITEINIGRFFMITIAMNTVGQHNMAELYLRLAFGEDVHVPEHERYSDIGQEETWLIREVDNEPTIITGKQLEASYRQFS